jgi:hypothetical protein
VYWLINSVVAILVYVLLVWRNRRKWEIRDNGGCFQLFIVLLPMDILSWHKYVGLTGALFGLWMYMVDVSFSWLAKKCDSPEK